MIKLKIFSCLMLLLVMNISGFSYESPFHPPFTSSGRPYILKDTPSSLFFSKETFGLALESAAGNYNFLHLFPWPAIEAYGRFRYKKFGGSIAIIDRYQFTTRDEMQFTSPLGEDLGKGYDWNYDLIYTLRTGLAYQILPNFVLGLSGDMNYGLKRYDLKVPAGTEDQFPGLVTHEQYTDYSGSFSVDGVITSKTNYPILEVLYESKVRLNLDEIDYFVPAQVSIFLNLPLDVINVGVNYYRRFGQYRDSNDTLRTTVSNDFALDCLTRVNADTKLYSAFYTLSPNNYATSSKGIGISAGPCFAERYILREVLLIYETGGAQGSNAKLTRYGLRIGFSL